MPLIAGLTVGCGGGSDLLSVTGKVTNADGSPVTAAEGGLVLFNPAGSGKAATGNFEKDGTFTMMTEKPGDGVKPGTYKVVLQLWKNYRAGTLAVPPQYGSATTTPLEATVDADHTVFEFKVEK